VFKVREGPNRMRSNLIKNDQDSSSSVTPPSGRKACTYEAHFQSAPMRLAGLRDGGGGVHHERAQAAKAVVSAIPEPAARVELQVNKLQEIV
jgi:hypothetical protein